jgi:hypothetical protein
LRGGSDAEHLTGLPLLADVNRRITARNSAQSEPVPVRRRFRICEGGDQTGLRSRRCDSGSRKTESQVKTAVQKWTSAAARGFGSERLARMNMMLKRHTINDDDQQVAARRPAAARLDGVSPSDALAPGFTTLLDGLRAQTARHGGLRALVLATRGPSPASGFVLVVLPRAPGSWGWAWCAASCAEYRAGRWPRPGTQRRPIAAHAIVLRWRRGRSIWQPKWTDGWRSTGAPT